MPHGRVYGRVSSLAEEEIFAFICRYAKANCGVTPTMREICDEFQMSSTSIASFRVKQLVKHGAIVLSGEPSSPRRIRIPGARFYLPGETCDE